MPFALATIGVFLVVAGARGVGNIKALGQLLVGDFTGQHNFLTWIFAIGLIGGLGYVPGMEKLSRAFLILLFVVLVLVTKGGFLAQIQTAFRNAGSGTGSGGTTTAPTVNTAVNGAISGLSGSTNSGSNGQ